MTRSGSIDPTAFLRHLRDQGAIPWRRHGQDGDIAKLAIPSLLAGLAGLPQSISAISSGFGELDRIVPVLTAASLLGICTFVVVSRQSERPAQGEILPGTAMGRTDFYRFPQSFRNTSKILLLPFTMMLGYAMWTAAPVALKGDRVIAGYLCDATSGEPLSLARVSLVDARDKPVVNPPEPSDATGFLYVELDWWMRLPATLKVATASCEFAESAINETIVASSCGGASVVPQRPPKFQRIWRLQCRKRSATL